MPDTHNLSPLQKEALDILSERVSLVRQIPDATSDYLYIWPMDYGLSVNTFRSLASIGLAIETRDYSSGDRQYKYRLADNAFENSMDVMT